MSFPSDALELAGRRSAVGGRRPGAPLWSAAVLLVAVALGAAWAPAPLRFCADPNNIPFSNRQREGFENRIAELVGRELGRPVAYTWWAQRRGFVRETLAAGSCDVIVGVPNHFDRTATTLPYYASTYVFVSRSDRGLDISSFDDERLRRLTIGVQLVGDDGANTPPVHALGRRGIVGNVRGYSVFGNYAEPNPPARIIDAVVNGDVDVAIAWGPMAGYFAKHAPVPLRLHAVEPTPDVRFLPFTFEISMGVRRADTTLRGELNRVIERRRHDIDRILADYGVPRVDAKAER
jgi:mxaJ protein